MQKPPEIEPAINAIYHIIEGEKKKGIVDIMQIKMVYFIVAFACLKVLTKKPHVNKPIKLAVTAI